MRHAHDLARSERCDYDGLVPAHRVAVVSLTPRVVRLNVSRLPHRRSDPSGDPQLPAALRPPTSQARPNRREKREKRRMTKIPAHPAKPSRGLEPQTPSLPWITGARTEKQRSTAPSGARFRKTSATAPDVDAEATTYVKGGPGQSGSVRTPGACRGNGGAVPRRLRKLNRYPSSAARGLQACGGGHVHEAGARLACAQAFFGPCKLAGDIHPQIAVKRQLRATVSVPRPSSRDRIPRAGCAA